MKKVNLIIIGCALVSLTSCYDFNRKQAEKDAESKGKQTLLEAESSKKAKIEEAKADLESAKLERETKKVRAEADAQAKLIKAKANAEAKVISSKADAQAIANITKAVQGNEDFLRYKQIKAISTGKAVYVPTEGGMPIIMQNK